MNLNIDTLLILLGLVFFALGTFGAVAKINPVAAGLFCVTLTLLT